MESKCRSVLIQSILNRALNGKDTKVILKNGYQYTGVHIIAYDNDAVLVDQDGTDVLIMMDAVSTIIHGGSNRPS